MDADRRSEPLTRNLRELKEQGCSLLVVNDAESVDAICTRLGGESHHERRRCYVPITTTVASVLDRHAPTPQNGALFGVVDVTATEAVRGIATPIQPGQLDVDAEWYTRIDDLRDLSEIVTQIEGHLGRFADRGGAFGPGEVRLCVESLDPFLGQDGDDPDLQQFLESVTQLVRDHRAMGHFHVASGTAPEMLAAIEPYFDATIRVRTTGDGTVQQRWILRDSDLETDWLELAHP